MRNDDVLQHLHQLGVDVTLFAGGVAHQIAAEEQMSEQSSRHGRLRRQRIVGQFHDAADVMQDRSSGHQIAVQRRFQLRVVGGIALRQPQARTCHRQGVFQQTAGEGVELADRGRQPLERLGVPVEQPQHQPAQRFVGDARFRQTAQFGEHLVAVVA